jgi:hypothetical protein
MPADAKRDWEAYVAQEKTRIAPFLAAHAITLDAEQPQVIGERYLTRPVGGGRKVVFFGRKADGERVVIKSSSEPQGAAELELERRMRGLLGHIGFAYETFFSPDEVLFDSAGGVLVTEYIAQDRPFLERALEEQFAIALSAFKAQERAHAVTAEHWRSLEAAMGANEYFIKPGEYAKAAAYANDLSILKDYDERLFSKLDPPLDETIELISGHAEALERYGGFLTHWDFTPQNFRIRDSKLYLLDHASIRFGNKYESWARFINFMTLYNPPLADALAEYVRLNRTPEEVLTLKIMRAYRLLELIRYYATWLGRAEENDRALALARIAFWSEALAAVLQDKKIAPATIEEYKKRRDALRSEAEKLRQQGLH